MGMRVDFICPGCGYSAHISGGADSRMHAATQTILCLDCRDLYDVVASTGYPTNAPKGIPLKCPNSPAHAIKVWEHPGPCPNCGQTMTHNENGTVTMWD